MSRRCYGKWYANQLFVQYCDDKVVLWTAYDDPNCREEPSCYYAELRWDEVLKLAGELIDWLWEAMEREREGGQVV